jgi:hypothetical protein
MAGRINEGDHPLMVELPLPRGGFRETSFALEAGIETKLGRGSYAAAGRGGDMRP